MSRELITRPAASYCPDTELLKEIDAATRALRTAKTVNDVKALRAQLETLRARYAAVAAAACH